LTQRLVNAAGSMLERRTSRRGLLARAALVGSAMVVAPWRFLTRPGSAMEGINGPLAIFGTLNQSFPAGGPVPAGFYSTQTGFTSGIATTFSPTNSNNDYIPANTRWPYIQSWLFSIEREIFKDTVLEVAYNGNHSLRLPIFGGGTRSPARSPIHPAHSSHHEPSWLPAAPTPPSRFPVASARRSAPAGGVAAVAA